MGEAGYIKGVFLDYIFFNEDNGEKFNDIAITKIGFIDDDGKERYFSISEEAVNEV